MAKIGTFDFFFRIYKLERDALSSLFRLFRGKKLNPLRSRIDSYLYDVDQLFIGTLGFCVVFFLFPTILMYYVVFLIVSTLFRFAKLCFENFNCLCF